MFHVSCCRSRLRQGETEGEDSMKRMHLTLAVCGLLLASLAGHPAWATTPGDINTDGRVDVTDRLLLAGSWAKSTGQPGFDLRCDLNNDGTVNIMDLLVLGDNWQSGCMALIPGGSFLMGDSFSEGSSDELPVHTVNVSPYYMDTCEVTNAQYAAALNWAYGQGELIAVTSGIVYKYNSGTSYSYCDTTTSSSWSRITWNGSTFGVEAGKENHPMVLVSWYGSVAYANWRSAMQGKPLCYDLSTWTCNFATAGYRLPTEAEWEKASRSGVAGHRFPWSDTDDIQHARANYFSWFDYSYDTSPTRGNHPTFATGNEPYTNPVGYFAPNGYGLYDMAGNACEWCNDWYSSTYYSTPPSSNPTGPGGTNRVQRGGSWNDSARYCRVAARNFDSPGYRFSYGGFRVVLGSP
jgi:sulfatase modifying factor 1